MEHNISKLIDASPCKTFMKHCRGTLYPIIICRKLDFESALFALDTHPSEMVQNAGAVYIA